MEFRWKEEEPKICGCGVCGGLLRSNVNDRTMVDGNEVNTDCFYRALGLEMKRRPQLQVVGGSEFRRN